MLVDTSVWIDHFRRRNPTLATHLEQGDVATHDFVIGELACGSLKDRATVRTLMDALPRCAAIPHDEVLHLIDAHKLMATGLGWVDVHLLASALLAGMPLWTLDGPLMKAATRLGLAGAP